MELTLLIIFGIVLIALAVVGGMRGVHEGTLALIGTLIGAVLVDLWHPVWYEWVRESLRPEIPAVPTWAIASTVFLGVVVLVGYGSGLLFPRQPRDDEIGVPLRERIVGVLLGLLNGALVCSYLLRYTIDILHNPEFDTVVATSVTLQTLYDWLPWFVMSVVFVLSVMIIARLVIRLLRKAMHARGLTPREDSIASAASLDERFEAVNNKISRRLPDA